MKQNKVFNIKSKQEDAISHFTVSIFLKNDKTITIDDVKVIEVNAQAGLLVIAGENFVKVYPIVNIEHYGWIVHEVNERK